MPTAKHFIESLGLHPHIEGGYFKRLYESKDYVVPPSRFNGKRRAVTSIYYLLEGDDSSAFHKVNSDEIWNFYYGSSITLYLIDENANLKTVILGNPITDKNAVFQTTTTANTWFAAEVNDKSSFALVGCVVAPGFEYEDFELAKREDLILRFPQHHTIITKLTQENR